jgi:serine/threonine-protein kinase
VPDGPLPAGTRIGGYVIEGLIASGSMGSVYRAHEADLRRDVAIKFPSATDELSRRRFLREARLAAGLRHSHIVAVFAVGEFGGRPYIVTEYVPGGSLDQRVRKAGPLWPGPAARLIAQAARALDVAHARGVVHRDVKPANLLLTDNGEAMVTDFGLARPLTPPAAEDGTPPSAALTGEGVLVGTPQYMAPELGRGALAGPAGDIYALGCTFHYLMTGEHPFQAASAFEVLRMHAELPFPDIRARLPKIPHRLAAALRRAVEKDPARRFASAGEMADELEAALDDPGVWDSLRTSLSSISVPVVQGLTGLGETGPLSAVPPAARPWLIGGAVLLAALAGLWVLRKIAAGLGF